MNVRVMKIFCIKCYLFEYCEPFWKYCLQARYRNGIFQSSTTWNTSFLTLSVSAVSRTCLETHLSWHTKESQKFVLHATTTEILLWVSPITMKGKGTCETPGTCLSWSGWWRNWRGIGQWFRGWTFSGVYPSLHCCCQVPSFQFHVTPWEYAHAMRDVWQKAERVATHQSAYNGDRQSPDSCISQSEVLATSNSSIRFWLSSW